MEETQIQDSSQSSSNNGVSFPTIGEPKKSSGAKTLLIVGILVLVAILGFVIYKSASTTEEEVPTDEMIFEDLTTPSTETVQTFTPAPSASPSAKVDKSKVAIQIQNGTGIPGEAAYLQTQLTTLGYSNIKVGNSDTTVTAATVTFSSTLDSTVVSEITQKLNSIYQTVTTKTASAPTFDVVVITGLRKGATAAPASTTVPSASTSPSPSSTRSPSPTPTSTPRP
jgi:hypothetical protein